MIISTFNAPAKLVRQFKERHDCMVAPHFDRALYLEWLHAKSKLDYPEWIIQRDNPDQTIAGLNWGTLWVGWLRAVDCHKDAIVDQYLAA